MNSDRPATLADPDDEPQHLRAGDSRTVPLLVFRLGGVFYAVAPGSVREVVSDITPVPVPGVPLFVRGLSSIGGRIVVLVNLGLLIGGNDDVPPPGARYLVLTADGGAMAAAVDELVGIIEVPSASVKAIAAERGDTATETFVHDERHVTVLDIARLFALAARRAEEGSPWTS